jgi:dihydroorotate dehydrogenase (NAD+) catalytic subunit
MRRIFQEKNYFFFLQSSRKIIQENSLPLHLIGCGGVTHASHFDEFLQAGAEIAMSATGMMWDPFLALRWQNRK